MTFHQRGALGLVTLVCLVIGNMIGAGVYISTSYALGALGDGRLVLVAWAIGGVHALCGSIAYAALARRASLSGGEYTFLTEFVHPSVGFMAGWISIIAGFTAPIAAAAMVFGEYALGETTATVSVRCVATGWVVLCAYFHCVDLRTGTLVNNWVVASKFLGFALFMVAALVFVVWKDKAPGWESALDKSLFATDYLGRLSEPEVFKTMLIQLFFISLAYTGFNASIYIAGDLPSGRWVPLSMVLACAIVTVVYLLLNGMFLMGASREVILEGGDYFVSSVAKEIGGLPLQWVMRVTIALSSATSVLAMLATGPRVLTMMSRDGWLPRRLDQSPTPRIAILVQATASLLIVWFANLLDLISYLGLTLTLCGALATGTLWFAFSEMNRRERVRWWEHLGLAIYVVGAVVLIAVAWWVKREQFWLTLGTFASGILVYLLSSKSRNSRGLEKN
jgi:amino acid transporter